MIRKAERWYKNHIKITLLIIFSLFALESCYNEYFDYHEKTNTQTIASWSWVFDIANIEERELDLYSTPDKKVLETLIGHIRWTKKILYIESYILTDKDIIKEVIESKKRGVEVRVILEKNVFGAWNMNKKTFDNLQENGIEVVYSDNGNYTFTHSKMMIFDDEYLISSWNFSHSMFVTNKEFLLFWKNNNDFLLLKNVFLNDFNHIYYNSCNNTLVISPVCPRNQLESLLNTADKSIYIFAELISDDKIEKILMDKAKKWVDIKILLWDIDKVSGNKEKLDILKNAGIKIFSPKKPFIHAKTILVDNKFIYIWSINLTTNSIENNREIWIIFKNDKIADKIENEFSIIFSNVQ